MVTVTLDEPANEQIRFAAKVVPCEGNLCGSDAQATVDATTSSDFERRVYYNSVEDRDANGNSRVDGKWGADGNNPIYWLYSSRYITIDAGQMSGTASWETQADSDTASESFLVSVSSLSWPEYQLGWPHPATPNVGNCGSYFLSYCYKAYIHPPGTSRIAITGITASMGNEGTNFIIFYEPNSGPFVPVNYSITQVGDFLASTTPPGIYSNNLSATVNTVDDSIDEPDGSVTITFLPGNGYRLPVQSIHTFQVLDNDDPPQMSPSPPSTPTVSLTATGNGAEGEDVTFGIESSPPPLTPLDVTISLDQTGGILADSNTGQRTITIPTAGFASFTIPTIDDGIVDENTITITILDGNGYTVGVPSSNTITIPDNDVATDKLIGMSDSVQEPETPQQEQPQPSFTADPTVVANIKEYAAETYRGQEHVDRWHRVLKTFGVEEFPGLTTMTSEEAYTYVQQGWNRWVPVVAELKVFEAWQEQQQPPQPEQPPQQEQQPIPVNLVSNGSFEAPIVTAHNGQWQQFAPSTAGISWTVTGDSLEIQRGILGGASDGSQHAELDAQGSVTISQTLNTVSGQAYEISFDYKARPNTASNTNGMNVTWNGVDIAPNLTLGNTWQTYTVNATGTGSDTISFADAGTSDGIGTFLDNVSVMRTGSPLQ